MDTFKDVASIALQIQAELYAEQRKTAALQKHVLELQEQLRQAYVVIAALNATLALKE